MSKEFNRSEYTKAAKAAGVWYKGTVCATVVDGKVIATRNQNRLALYLHLGYEVPEKYEGVKPAELVFDEEPKAETKKQSKTAAPKAEDRISVLESRMDSIESKLDSILAKLG